MTALPEIQMSEDCTLNHEFINALASVKCLTELLAEYPTLERSVRTCLLNIMRQETERMVRLANGAMPPAAAAGSF